MKTFKGTDKGKKRKLGKSSAIEGTRGFVRTFLIREDGDIFPEGPAFVVDPEDVSQCDRLKDLKELLIREVSPLSRLLPKDFNFRLADEETYTTRKWHQW